MPGTTGTGPAVREVTVAASLAALGVVVPILFHMVGMGRYFLPMHLPVLAAGLLLRPRIAWTVGLVTPWLSSLLTGMPPMPMPVLMSIELVALVQTASLLSAAKAPVWVAVSAAVALRCAATFAVTTALATQLGIPEQAAGWASVASGAPGIALQIVSVPILLASFRRVSGRKPDTA